MPDDGILIEILANSPKPRMKPTVHVNGHPPIDGAMLFAKLLFGIQQRRANLQLVVSNTNLSPPMDSDK